MNMRQHWILAIAVSGFLGAGHLAPALSWDGANRSGTAGVRSAFPVRVPQAPMRNGGTIPRTFARHIGVHDGLRFRRHAQFPVGSSIVILPYLQGVETIPMAAPPKVASDGPTKPIVIVMSNPPERTVPDAPRDYSYVSGCRAIPNGYHCDIPGNEVAD
jgi:hypothetical protein